jgi:NAD(P)-dependent dehydrogenase (short-subunit alcohol dehydrogenase family)
MRRRIRLTCGAAIEEDGARELATGECGEEEKCRGSQMTLKSKVAIVTGAGGGIGRRFAEALGRAEASVVLADINGEAAEAAALELREEGLEALAVATDVTNESSVARMASAAVSRFGGVDILVNNAALMAELPSNLPLIDFRLEEWDRAFRVNLTGALLCIRAVVPSMKQRKGGKIINQSSGGAFLPGHAYGISKLALLGLTNHMALELGPFNITVNAIAPGMISSEAGQRARPTGMVEYYAPTIPLKPVGDPEDLVGALLFLASSASDWVTGQTICVDGGWIKRI